MQRSGHKRPRLEYETPTCNVTGKEGSTIESGKEGAETTADSGNDEDYLQLQSSVMRKPESTTEWFQDIIVPKQRTDPTTDDDGVVAPVAISPRRIDPSENHNQNCLSVHHDTEPLKQHFLFHWALQAANSIWTGLSIFDCQCVEPYQIPNNVLTRISNELIHLMGWFGIQTTPEDTTLLAVSCLDLLSALFKTVSLASMVQAHRPIEDDDDRRGLMLSNDAAVAVEARKVESLFCHSGRWMNPRFAQCLLKATPAQFPSIRLQTFSFTALQMLREYYRPLQPQQVAASASRLDLKPWVSSSLSQIFILGTSSMVFNIWSELWGRMQRVSSAINGLTTAHQLIEEMLPLLPRGSSLSPSDPSCSSACSPPQTPTSKSCLPVSFHVQSLLTMHLPVILNEHVWLFQHAMVPTEFHDTVLSTLRHVRQIHQTSTPALVLSHEDSNQERQSDATPRPSRNTSKHNFASNECWSLQREEEEERIARRRKEDDEEWELGKDNRRGRTTAANETAFARSNSSRAFNGDVSDVLFHKATGSWFFSWWNEALSKRRYKYYSSKNYGDTAKQLAISERNEMQKMLSDKANETISSTENGVSDSTSQGVNFNKRTGYWSARHKDGRSLSFNKKLFGFRGARRVAEFAKALFERSDHAYTREQVFQLYKEKNGALPYDEEDYEDDHILNNNSPFCSREPKEENIRNELLQDEEREEEDEDEKTEEEEFYPEQEHPDDEDEDHDVSRNQSGVIGVTFNTSKKIWSAKLTAFGITRSCNWASGKYGHETARQLAIVAKGEGLRLGYFPSREVILKAYEEGNRMKSNCDAKADKTKEADYIDDQATVRGYHEGGGMSTEELEQVSLDFFVDLVNRQSNPYLANNPEEQPSLITRETPSQQLQQPSVVTPPPVPE